MSRVNLSIDENLYKKIQGEANKKGVSVNNYIYNLIVLHFDKDTFNLIEEFENLKAEAEIKAAETGGKFTLNDLPTYKNLDEKLKNSQHPESVKQVKSRLSMMFKNSAGIDWTINNNGRLMYVERVRPADDELLKRLMKYKELMVEKGLWK